MSRISLDSVRRVLIVKLSSLGDVVHATPCLTALRRRLPSATLVWAVERAHAALLRHHPDVDELIEVAPSRGRLQHVQVIWRALASRPRFDLALDLQGTLRSAAWIYLSRARWRAGIGSPRPGWQVSLTAGQATHAVENCAAAARAIGVAVEDLAPRLYCSPSAEASAGQILRQHGVPQTGFVVLNPFSRWPSKEWPMERWAEVARCLEAEFGQTVVITGAADEAIRARGLTQTCSGGAIVSLVGNLTLEQAMSVYRRARLMISGDSGPMHVAAALGTPLLALFGPTWPERSGPWGQRDAVLQARRPPTHHTYRHDPEGCYIRGLPVSSVLAKLRGLLGASLYSTLA